MSKQSNSSFKKWKMNFPQHHANDSQQYPDPYGFQFSSSDSSVSTSASSSNKTSQQQDTDKRKLQEKKAWELAMSPFKGLFMTMFLLYMSGSQIHIFPIIMVAVSIINPLKAILQTNQTFQPFAEEQIPVLFSKITYIFFHGIGLAMALVKCYWLDLLPTATDLFISTIPKQAIEYAAELQM